MASLKKCLLIVNPIAGGNDKTELVTTVRDYAQNEGYEESEDLF